MNKKEVIALLEVKAVKEVEFLDTYGSYRDSYIHYVDGTKQYFECGYRSEYAIKNYLESKKIPYTS